MWGRSFSQGVFRRWPRFLVSRRSVPFDRARKEVNFLFVTMHNYKIGEGTQLDVARTAEEFLGTVASIPGFRAYYMIDGGDHRIGSVSIFDTREGIEECDKLAAEFVTERLGGFRLSPGEVTEGEVLASQASR
jgi:heme-degrading monooxygenase HmoA